MLLVELDSMKVEPMAIILSICVVITCLLRAAIDTVFLAYLIRVS